MTKEERLPIWRALSELFLDTEIDDTTYLYIARTVRQCGLSSSEAEGILWYEVYPVLEHNLRSVAGVWEGWSDEWLLDHLKMCEEPGSILGEALVISEIRRCWAKVNAFLAIENA